MTPESLARWRARHAAELASAAAFGELRQRLSAIVPAAPGLLDALSRAEQDELRHAGLCEQVVGPLPSKGSHPMPELPPPKSDALPVALVEHVVFLLCAGEAIAVAMLTHSALRATAPGVADLLRTIAVDESRHWQLGWDALDVLLPVLSPVERAEASQLAPLQAVMAVSAAERVPEAGVDGEAWGLLGSAEASRIARGVMRDVVGPRLARVGLWRPQPLQIQ